MIDESTRKEIDKAASKTLKRASMKEPPFYIEDLLEYLEVDREFYDLEDPSLTRRIWHKVKVGGQILKKIANKINLSALWLPDRDKIYVDSSLPAPKKDWASFHDATHTILKWHRSFFLGDTAQTLEPEYQDILETEANYGASALMFGGKVFTKEALDTTPEWSSVATLKKRYKKSWVTTLRRYVQCSHYLPMALVISTPWWKPVPEDQEHKCRHFISSPTFKIQFACISRDLMVELIDDNTNKRIGGPVGEFSAGLLDVNGNLHEFQAESFFNRHDILTLFVYNKKLKYRS